MCLLTYTVTGYTCTCHICVKMPTEKRLLLRLQLVLSLYKVTVWFKTFLHLFRPTAHSSNRFLSSSSSEIRTSFPFVIQVPPSICSSLFLPLIPLQLPFLSFIFPHDCLFFVRTTGHTTSDVTVIAVGLATFAGRLMRSSGTLSSVMTPHIHLSILIPVSLIPSA